ncbi:hypothetical protein AMC82_CH03931 [Rhizobium phaseoli]|uniref:hypothetical protein n=1 Tax=Rhizobium phaseoli TaxID=396 RepID=UPI0007F187F4|nr:hypothetical protein [Rhizobium phaseoli]ANL55089.1 hypothetical protein AMC86_CH04007 [Rhizobium phaseoli]ANL67519.1 hypothetical protein AMC84_CH03945 [Rhizobium phaseoli]ANL80332.1 hypothetical protein AMC82_CH03931 [Rhizobium phaseoli]
MNVDPKIKLEKTAEEFSPPGFDPRRSSDPEPPEWIGKRRRPAAPMECVPWRWPTEDATARQRYEAFDGWHDIAMQILDKEGGSFRLMAAYKKVMQWKAGEIWATDEELAAKSGRCSERTISRDIAAQRRLGIIIVENGWRKVGGKFLRSRTIKLGVPAVIPPYVMLSESQNHIDTRGLPEDGNHIDTRGPNHIDTRGLITIDAIEKGASGNVSA